MKLHWGINLLSNRGGKPCGEMHWEGNLCRNGSGKEASLLWNCNVGAANVNVIVNCSQCMHALGAIKHQFHVGGWGAGGHPNLPSRAG